MLDGEITILVRIMNLAINKLNQVLTLLFFLINFYPFLYSQSSYYKVIGDDQLIAQLSYPVVVPSGDNSGLFLFSNNLDSGISLLKLDSCGKVNWGKNFTFGFNFPVIYDAIKVGEDELLLLSGELSNSVTYFLTRFSTKGELIVSWNLTMPEQFKPSSIEYLSNGNVLCNGLMTEGFFSNPVIFEFKLEDGQVIKSKKFSILSESANAKGLKTGKIILVTDHNMILLDENWNPDWSVKINASLTGSTLPYFSTVKPSVENGKIATLCFTDVLNNYFLIFDDQGQLMKTSKPFAADLPVNTTFGIVLSFFSRSSIHYLPDNTYMFVLNAYRNGDSWPTIYKFNDSAEKVFENAFSDSTFLTSSQKISKDYSLYILGSGRLTKNITLLHTNPQLQVGCMDFFNLPNVFGQIERTFWTTEDTLPHSEELYIQVDPIIPEEDPMGEINEEVLCQSYYGPPLPDIVRDRLVLHASHGHGDMGGRQHRQSVFCKGAGAIPGHGAPLRHHPTGHLQCT